MYTDPRAEVSPPFDRVMGSAWKLPESLSYPNLAALLFDGDAASDQDLEIILGTIGNRSARITLRALRHATLALIEEFERRGLRPGDTVCLVRLPRTSETLVAATYFALSVWGARVLLPMYLDSTGFGGWLVRSEARAVVWSSQELMQRGTEGDQRLFQSLAATAGRLGLQTLCMTVDLNLELLLDEQAPSAAIEARDSRVEGLRRGTSERTESLLLTTSGTSGQAKMVRYTQGSLLRSCQAWQTAGLFRPELLGGRSLCLLLCHSMGIRALWNALWTRRALCLIPPEWFAEHPERVRAMLLQMRPEHVTGGPGVYRALLELARVFPQLKDMCLTHLRCAVSSGAAFDPALARRLRSALGLRLDNAFGMTETMQVCTTLLNSEAPSSTALGAPLPGVELGLARLDGASSSNLYRLYVRSPFGTMGYLGERQPFVHGNWLDTGDVVETGPTGLQYVGRHREDFIKDGFGVKVPRARLQELYDGLGESIAHLEFFALREEPGLGALVFVEPQKASSGAVTDSGVLRKVRRALESRLEKLHLELEEFEFRHLTVLRFACIAEEPARTPKGNVSRASIEARHMPLIEQLTGHYLKEPGLEQLDRESFTRSAYARLSSPRRGELLRLARLDKDYVRGSGDRLVYREKGQETEVIDLVGGFGGNLLGHCNPRIVHEVTKFIDAGRIFHGDQGSAHVQQGEMARRLAAAVGKTTGGSYVVRFGSTGAEAVEMAIAHAFLEHREWVRRLVRDQKRRFGGKYPARVQDCVTRMREILRGQRPRVLALAGSFHGHSLGARSALGAQDRRAPFAAMSRIEPIFIDRDGQADLEAIVERDRVTLPVLVDDGAGGVCAGEVRSCGIFAALVEPILGEGGVWEVSARLLSRLAAFEFPLIIDEIQCGLGRSGTLLASEGAVGHYYLFAKALGGGMAKLSAVLIDRDRYVERFDEYYSSTFAGDPFSCTVGCAVLDLIEHDRVAERARERGEAMRAALERVRERFPDIIRGVRGRGLMLGVDLETSGLDDSFILRALVRHEYFGTLAAGYLLHEHCVRILPTLSAPNTLRVEPSAYIDDAAIAQVELALTGLCETVRARDTRSLVEFLVRDEDDAPDAGPTDTRRPRIPSEVEQPVQGAVRVGFVNHFVWPERELVMAEPALAGMSNTARRALFYRMMRLMEMKPIIAFGRNIMQDRLWFLSVLVTADTATLEHLHRSHDRSVVVERIQAAVDLAAEQGCSVVSLGAYASILTHDGQSIMAPAGVRLTSGNTFTAAVAVHRIRSACKTAGIDPSSKDTKLAVLGASGNIGSAIARELVLGKGPFQKAVLIARGRGPLEQLRRELLEAAEAVGQAPPQLEISTELSSLRLCNVIATATNANEPLVYAHHLGQKRPVVVGDVAVPAAVSAGVRMVPGVALIPLSATVPVPGESGFTMSSHSVRGTAFCCAAEGMMLGLEAGVGDGLNLVGPIQAEGIARMTELGVLHGFLKAVESDRTGGG